MHAISHSLAHRGPGASRARARWQPYSSINASTPVSVSRSPQHYLNTPTSTVLPPATSQVSPAIPLPARNAQPPTPAKPTPAPASVFREQKCKYVAGLIDQAVKSLCDIWQPEDIPADFRAKPAAASDSSSTNGSATLFSEEPLINHVVRNVQLPSPISPTTQPSPISTSPITPTAQIAAASCRTNQVVPIRGFVHEVLRRSRTSTSVLQTALCYLEAVRSKVPEVIAREANEDCPEYMHDQCIEDRIVIGDVFEKSDLAGLCEAIGQSTSLDYVQTVRLGEVAPQEPLTAPPTELLAAMDVNDSEPQRATTASSKKPSPSLPPLPPLPSPLRCPRRTFLACLILASKFLQDRSYSNKAWAKLAGLPPREVGRCERAVGEALEWRLWVGKAPAASSTPVGTHRAVARCRSEATLQLPTCGWQSATAPTAPLVSRVAAASSSSSSLRRSATVPEIGGAARARTSLSLMMDSYMAPAYPAFSVESEEFSSQFGPVSLSKDVSMSSLAGSVSYIPSPPLSTPSLAYSPMSTASSASSDDGERTAHFSGSVDIPYVPSPLKFSGSTGYSSGYYHALEQPHMYHQLAAINQSIARGPIQLPPLSEAVSNPVMYEATIRPVGHGEGDIITAHNSFSNWSVSS